LSNRNRSLSSRPRHPEPFPFDYDEFQEELPFTDAMHIYVSDVTSLTVDIFAKLIGDNILDAKRYELRCGMALEGVFLLGMKIIHAFVLRIDESKEDASRRGLNEGGFQRSLAFIACSMSADHSLSLSRSVLPGESALTLSSSSSRRRYSSSRLRQGRQESR
jgi:hypothetical protein